MQIPFLNINFDKSNMVLAHLRRGPILRTPTYYFLTFYLEVKLRLGEPKKSQNTGADLARSPNPRFGLSWSYDKIL